MSKSGFTSTNIQTRHRCNDTLPAKTKLGYGDGKENNVPHPAPIEGLSHVTIRSGVQLTTLDQQQERVQTQDCNQSHDQRRKQNTAVLERVRQEQDSTRDKPNSKARTTRLNIRNMGKKVYKFKTDK